MRKARSIATAGILVALLSLAAARHSRRVPASLGFDRNDYPGDAVLPALRNTFRFTGYWLNNPPGENSNSWRGKRSALRAAGFGFAVLFNGRSYEQLKAPAHAAQLGTSDADQAINTARAEGFPLHTIVFLDQEQGGRLMPEQRAYLHAWVDEVNHAGYSAGVYCSGVPFKEASGATIITAEDIRQNAGNRVIRYWIANDTCPPAPGCAFRAAPPSRSGAHDAAIWQFALSPRRAQFASACTNYAGDGNCYAPGTPIFVDLDTAESPDPSHGRGRD